jgi:hypothetical protein
MGDNSAVHRREAASAAGDSNSTEVTSNISHFLVFNDDEKVHTQGDRSTGAGLKIPLVMPLQQQQQQQLHNACTTPNASPDGQDRKVLKQEQFSPSQADSTYQNYQRLPVNVNPMQLSASFEQQHQARDTDSNMPVQSTHQQQQSSSRQYNDIRSVGLDTEQQSKAVQKQGRLALQAQQTNQQNNIQQQNTNHQMSPRTLSQHLNQQDLTIQNSSLIRPGGPMLRQNSNGSQQSLQPRENSLQSSRQSSNASQHSHQPRQQQQEDNTGSELLLSQHRMPHSGQFQQHHQYSTRGEQSPTGGQWHVQPVAGQADQTSAASSQQYQNQQHANYQTQQYLQQPRQELQSSQTQHYAQQPMQEQHLGQTQHRIQQPMQEQQLGQTQHWPSPRTQHQCVGSSSPPPPPPVLIKDQHHLTNEQIVKKKGRFTFVETSPLLETHKVPLDPASVQEVLESPIVGKKKGRFTLLQQPLNQPRQERRLSNGSVVSASDPTQLQTTSTSTAPKIKRKGRFVVTSVDIPPNARVMTGVPFQAVVTAQPVQPTSIAGQYRIDSNQQGITYGAPAVVMPPTTQHLQLHQHQIVYDNNSAPEQQQTQAAFAAQPVKPKGNSIPNNGSAGAPSKTLESNVLTLDQNPQVIQESEVSVSAPVPPDQNRTKQQGEGSAKPDQKSFQQREAMLHHQLGEGLNKPSETTSTTTHAKPVEKSGASTLPTNIARNNSLGLAGKQGLGKVFYFLEQMKTEVTDADQLIKTLQRDMKLLVSLRFRYKR